MLAYDREGEGPPLLLLHGTTSSRRVWADLMPALARGWDTIALDLPGHGESPVSTYTPPEWASEVVDFLDHQGLDQVTVVGHSAGGWTALELAKLGRARAVLALTPAGLWRKRSPLLTDLRLNANWWLGRLFGETAARSLALRPVRAVALRTVSARPADVPAGIAMDNARAAFATDSFPRHFQETRRLRFMGGGNINAPVKIVWGATDRIALERKSRSDEELPRQTVVETWDDCGHMVMWDAAERTLAAITELRMEPSPRQRAAGRARPTG